MIKKMRRVGNVMLALLAGILVPLIIWAALFAAIRKPLLQALRRAGAVALALLAGILAPLIIWVALAIAVKEQFQVWRLRRAPARTVDDVLMAAGLTLNRTAIAEPIPLMAAFPVLPVSQVTNLLARAGL